MPLRQEQPDYQRRWRLWRKLREIREESKAGSGRLLRRVRRLLQRAETLSTSTARTLQRGVLGGRLLDQAKEALRAVVSAVEHLEAKLSALQSLGL